VLSSGPFIHISTSHASIHEVVESWPVCLAADLTAAPAAAALLTCFSFGDVINSSYVASRVRFLAVVPQHT